MTASKDLMREHTQDFIALVREIYSDDFVPLHRPVFTDDDKNQVVNVIESNFVSSAGSEIEAFENKLAEYVGTSYAIATVNGTAALHVALYMAGVEAGTEVLTQAVSFVATANAIAYCDADPVFIDIELDSMGMSPRALRSFLEANAIIRNGQSFNKKSGARLSACVPMHSFGHPVHQHEIESICAEYHLPIVEDCAESLGSYVDGHHTGKSGLFGTFSFNGNKIITTGGGGMIVTNNEELAHRARHLTTTAKRPHDYEYFHDELGYNYRMPNLNAALGLAQMNKLDFFLKEKRKVASRYRDFFADRDIGFTWERDSTVANFWFNCLILDGLEKRNTFLVETNQAKIMTRPLWEPLNRLPRYRHCLTDSLENTNWLADRLVNIPSSVPQMIEVI